MRFEIRRTNDGRFYWLIVGEHGQVVAESDAVADKSACEGAIARVRELAATAPILDET
jgi:uncharacterized protein YegP (UPF0339 family)